MVCSLIRLFLNGSLGGFSKTIIGPRFALTIEAAHHAFPNCQSYACFWDGVCGAIGVR